MAKTSIQTGWCVDGLTIPPEDKWICSECDKPVIKTGQKTYGGWIDYNNNGKLGFIHFDCYINSLKEDNQKG